MNLFSPMSLKLPILLAAALALAAGAPAQDREALAQKSAEELQKAIAELATLRQSIEAERLPVSRQLTETEQKVADRKAEYAKAQRFQENQLVELNALKAEAKLRADEVKYVDSLLTEYARAFRSRLNFVEEPRFAALFEALEKAAASADLTEAQKFSQRSALLTASLKRNDDALGGELLDGQAIDKNGRVQTGKVALIGPVAVFADTGGEFAGLLQMELNKSAPSIVQAEEDIVAASRKLVTTGTGELALDPTLGNAFKLAALKQSLYEKLAEGGLVMVPLLALGLAALLIAFWKWYQFSRVRLVTERELQQVLRHLEHSQRKDALALARGIPGIAGDLLATAVERADEKKEYIEEIVYEKMLAARSKLERGISFLALTATTGPLLGLLGTVTGMIATFKLISSFGSGDPKLLASGISEALMATATGMGVAIPALLFHAFLSRKSKGILGSMEQTAVGFINGVPATEKTVFA
jgi:biopolymer transport protein ExbB